MGQLKRVGFGLLIALAGGGYMLYTQAQLAVNVVFIDNTTGQDVSVAVDGEDRGSLGSGQSLVLELEPGSHELVATAAGAEVDRGAFEVPEGSGFRGLFDVGGNGQYMVARARYDSVGGGADAHPVQKRQFMILPADVVPDGIDLEFPNSVTSNVDVTIIAHVCRYDSAADTVGCPNF